MEYFSGISPQNMVDLSNAERISIFFLMATVFFAVFFIFYIYSNAKKDGMLYSFIFLNCLMIVWCVGLILEEFSLHREQWLRWGSLWVSYLGICFFGYAWLLFCFYFTGARIKESKKNLVFLALPFVIYYLFLLTNHYHQLFYIVPKDAKRSFGPVYYILVFTTFVYICTGTALLLRFYLKSKGLARTQSLLVLLTCITVFVIVFFRVAFKWDIETIPISFILLSYGVYYTGLKKFSLFKVVPVSILSFLDSMEQGICIIDTDLDMVSSNRAFKGMFPCAAPFRDNEKITPFLDYLDSASICDEESAAILDSVQKSKTAVIRGKISLKHPDARTFFVIVQPAYASNGKERGRIISFRDISELVRLNYLLEQKNIEMLYMNEEYQKVNEEIMKYTLSTQELSVTKERNRILNELYGSIQMKFSSIILFAHGCIKDLRSNGNQNQENMEKLNQMVKVGLQEIRNSIYMQNTGEDTNSFGKNLEKLLISFLKEGIDIKLLVEGTIQPTNYPVRSAVFGIWQEALENSIKHGKATLIYVIIKFKENCLHLYIMDDGKGCEDIHKGAGLDKMEQWVQSLQGTISYGSLGFGEGFNIITSIPLQIGGQ